VPDPAPDDGKKWLGIPDRIWNLLFLSIATAIVTFLQSQHAATQSAGQQEIKTEMASKQAEVKTAVADVKNTVNNKAADLKEAVQAVPPAVAVEAAKVVEQKEAKGPDQ
jgi:hypothetical protein